MIAGAVRFLRQHPAGWPVLAGGIVAPLLAYALHHWVLYTFIYYWYLIYAMPVVLVLIALGTESVSDALLKRLRGAWLVCVPPLAVAALLASVNFRGVGRMGWIPERFTNPQQFDRGRFLWITYPDGKTVREPDASAK
jgi:hypothetical protein